MAVLTIRGLSEETLDFLRQEADGAGRSLTRHLVAVLDDQAERCRRRDQLARLAARLETAAALLAEQAAGRADLIAPDLLVPELASICRRKVRAGDVTLAEAAELFALLLAAAPKLVPAAELAASALELALRHDRPIGDALHLALALREGIPYVTAEERLVRALGPAFPCLRYLGDLV